MKHIRSALITIATVYASSAISQEATYFRYSEKESVGHMIVVNEKANEVPVKPIAVSILSGNSKTRHSCELRARENTVGRINTSNSTNATMQVASSNAQEMTNESFQISFSKSSAVISYDAAQSNCGTTASFAGTWRRVKSMEAAIAPK